MEPATTAALATTGAVAVDNIMAGQRATAANRLTKQMYKHRYQWSKADMEKAGFNPILAVSGGLSGSSPQAQMANPNYQMASTATDIMDVFKKDAEVGKITEETEMLKAKTNELVTQAELNTQEKRRVGHAINLLIEQAGNVSMQTELTQTDIQKAQEQIKLLEYYQAEWKNKADISSTPYLGQLLTFMERVVNMFKGLIPFTSGGGNDYGPSGPLW